MHGCSVSSPLMASEHWGKRRSNDRRRSAAACGLALAAASCWDFKSACELDGTCPELPLCSGDECAAPVEVSSCDVAAASGMESCGSDCAVPLSIDCSCLEGAAHATNPLVIGVIAPETFNTGASGPRRIPFMARWLEGLRQALEEWNQELPGEQLPTSRRPLALLRCNSNDVPTRATRALNHLTDDVQVPLVITASDNDTEALRYKALAAELPVVCSTCYAPPPADARLARLTWPILPPLLEQAPLAAARVAELARAASATADLPTIVSLSQDYPGINDFVAEVRRLLELERAFHQVPIVTPPPRESSISQGSVARSVIEARPQVIVVGMDSDFTTYYLREIERDWPRNVPRPSYVLTSLNQELGLLSEIVGQDDELRRRISGTGWWPDSDVRSNASALEARFQRRTGQALDQVQSGYDAFYAAAYAVLAADVRGQLDGTGVARSLERLTRGAPVDVGPAPIADALVQLLGGQDIDLTGTTSRLDWAPSTHAARSDVTLWCLGRAAEGSVSLIASAGPVWQATTGEISGDYDCP